MRWYIVGITPDGRSVFLGEKSTEEKAKKKRDTLISRGIEGYEKIVVENAEDIKEETCAATKRLTSTKWGLPCPDADVSSVIKTIASGGAPGEPGKEPPSQSGLPASTEDNKAETAFPVPGTDAWAAINRRRMDLIHKKNRDGLTGPELDEYEKLQSLSCDALERAFPAPTDGEKELTKTTERLGMAAKPLYGDDAQRLVAEKLMQMALDGNLGAIDLFFCVVGKLP